MAHLEIKKYLLIIDSVIILGSLLSIFFVVGYTQPLVIGPLESESGALMFALPYSDYLLFDDNFEFDSPITIFIDDENLELEAGRYYLKVISGLSSEIREIKTEVGVVLQFRRLSDGSVGVFNIGNSAVKVETYEIGTLVNSSLVSVDYNQEITNG